MRISHPGWEDSSVVKYFLCKHKDLSSNSSEPTGKSGVAVTSVIPDVGDRGRLSQISKFQA